MLQSIQNGKGVIRVLKEKSQKEPITMLLAEPIGSEVRAAQAYGYAMENDTKDPYSDNSDTM